MRISRSGILIISLIQDLWKGALHWEADSTTRPASAYLIQHLYSLLRSSDDGSRALCWQLEAQSQIHFQHHPDSTLKDGSALG